MRLTLNGEPIAELHDVQPDMPWFEARFAPTEGFATVEPLFREEREMSERRRCLADPVGGNLGAGRGACAVRRDPGRA